MNTVYSQGLGLASAGQPGRSNCQKDEVEGRRSKVEPSRSEGAVDERSEPRRGGTACREEVASMSKVEGQAKGKTMVESGNPTALEHLLVNLSLEGRLHDQCGTQESRKGNSERKGEWDGK